jgi:hypothetical protein
MIGLAAVFSAILTHKLRFAGETLGQKINKTAHLGRELATGG